MRRVFLNRISEMIRNENDTVFMTVDIGMWAIRNELEMFPERCMNAGIFEDGMFSIAAGMASRGLVPTVFGIQPYLVERTLEQIKMDLAYQQYGINVVGTGAAVDYSKYGYSHYCAEDAYVIKAIPGCEFYAPGSASEFLSLFNHTYRNGKTSFFRISDHPNVNYIVDVVPGKANVIKEGKKATIIVVSVLLDLVMEVCEDKDVTVIYYTTLEPFDRDTLVKNCDSKRVLIVEPEYEGTLYSDVIRTFEGDSLRVDTLAFPRVIFRNYGTYDDKMSYYGFTRENLATKIENIMK